MRIINKMKRKFKDMPLNKKMFLCLFILVIIPLILATIIINLKVSKMILKKSNEVALQRLKEARFNISDIINDVENISLKMLSDDNIQELLKYDSEKSNVNIQMLKLITQTSIENQLKQKSYMSICFSKEKDIVLQYGNYLAEEDTGFNEKAYKLKGVGFWTEPYSLVGDENKNTKDKVISYIRVVNDMSSQKQLGIERISIDENIIYNCYKNNNSFSNSSTFIVNDDGVVISSYDKEMISSKIKEDYIKKVLKEKEGAFLYKDNLKKTAIIFFKLDNIDWYIVQCIPFSEFNKEVNFINIIITITILGCLIFGVIFSFVLNKTVIAPLNSLEKEIIKITEGELKVDLQVNSKDEIGEISRSFVKMIKTLNKLIDQVYISDIREKQAKLKALQAQINPHFLYNTLDSIRWVAVKNKDYDVGEQIEALADIFRHVLNEGSEITTIGEEIEYLKNYMFLQESRFGEKVKVIFNVDERIKSCEILNLILQPLVENAMYHGLENKITKGSIEIIGEIIEKNIRFTIIDDGIGMDEEKVNNILEDKNSGFALKNIDERIKLRYGKEFGIKIFSEKNIGTKVQVDIPLIKMKDDY